jgi:CheY-like chemotaxis protein
MMLVDIGLPGMDGYEVASRIRTDQDLRSIVLVALTGYSREEDRDRSRAAGFDYHLVKPIDPDSLRRWSLVS